MSNPSTNTVLGKKERSVHHVKISRNSQEKGSKTLKKHWYNSLYRYNVMECAISSKHQACHYNFQELAAEGDFK